MPTYRRLPDGTFVDKHTGEPMETTGEVCAPMIASDIKAYMSPLGTGMIDGRRARREDLKRGNCREVDPSEHKVEYHDKKFAAKRGLEWTPAPKVERKYRDINPVVR